MPNLVGKSLGKYHIVERLGHGGMAEVYKAYHAKLDRYVTIKILHSYLVEGQDFLQRFEREARAVATLRHPHIVQIHDYDVQDDLYYMVVEFIDGGNLQVRIDELARAGAYMPIGQVLSVLRQIGDALDYAHRQGIIHRDIKPSNILLDAKGSAFLSDFGIARIVGSSQFTTVGTLIGTPAYMSPEQGMGEQLSDASDIYSLGVVAYHLLTGKVPFAADTPLAILQKQVNEPPIRPSALRPDLPPDVDGIIERALAKSAGERYQTAAEFCRALDAALPQDSMSKLDAGSRAGQVPTAAAPTVRMEEREALGSLDQLRAAEAAAEMAPPDVSPGVPAAEPAKRPPVRLAAESNVEAEAGPSTHVSEAKPAPPELAKDGRRLVPARLAVLLMGGIAVITAAVLLGWAASRGSVRLPLAPAPPARSTPTPYAWASSAGLLGSPTAQPRQTTSVARTTPRPTSTSRPTATLRPAVAAGVVYTEDFEDGQAQKWELETDWKVTLDGNNHVLCGGGHHWAFSNQDYWQDNKLSYRLKLIQGRIHLVSHHNDTGRYYVGYETDGSLLNKQYWPNTFIQNLAGSAVSHPLNTWLTVEIVSRGSELEFLTSGETEFTYLDALPLVGGDFAFETQSGAQACIDDVILEVLPSQ